MSATKKKTLLTVLVTIIGVLVAFVMVFPIVWLLMSSFKDSTELFAYPLHFLPEKFSLDSYASVIKSGFFQYVKNSLFLAVVGTLITLAISSMCGYALAIYRHEIPYTNKVFAVFLLGTLIPGEILTISQFTVISEIGLYNNIWGVILPVVTTTTGIFMYRQHFMTLPLSLAESARLDGASEFKIFTSIMMPLASSVTVSLTIFSFVWRWNDYIWPLLALSDPKKYTLQLALRTLSGAEAVNWTVLLSTAVLSMIPTLIVFIVFNKQIMNANMSSGVKG